MKEEDQILRKVGTGNPFRVPDGYFAGFNRELMSKLPEKEAPVAAQEVTLWQRVKPWIYMTAMFCGIMLSVRLFVGDPEALESAQATEAQNMSDEDWENMSNPSMIDDYSLYQFLTDAEEYVE